MTKDKRSKTSRRLWIIAAVAVIVGVAAFALINTMNNRSAAQADGQAQDGQIVTVAIGDLSASVTASGNIAAPREASLNLEVTGIVTDVPVRIGDEVEAGDVLVQLDTTALDRSLANAELSLLIQEANLRNLLSGTSETDLASAQASVASAQANLDKIKAGANPSDLAAARASLAAAQASYDDVVAGPSSDAVAQAEASLRNAEASLRQAQSAYDQVAGRPDVGMSQQALNLEQATNNYNSARAAYDQAIAGSSQQQIQQARSSVEQARASLQKLLDSPTATELTSAESQLAQAQAQLASVTTGATAEQIEVAEAQVEQARLQVQEATDNLNKASLRAPFAGVITALHVTEGERASGLAVEIADTSSLEVVLRVDEVDIGALANDQPVVVTLETWPGETIQGRVVSIAPKAAAGSSGITSYEVRVALNDTALPVRIGMTADADLIIDGQTGVLLAPSQAVTADREAGKYYVNLVRPGSDGSQTITRTEVTVGLKADGNIQITSGLNEGDQVLIGAITASETGTQSVFMSGTGGGGNPFGR